MNTKRRAMEIAAARYRRDTSRVMKIDARFKPFLSQWLRRNHVPIVGFWDVLFADEHVAVSERAWKCLEAIAVETGYPGGWGAWGKLVGAWEREELRSPTGKRLDPNDAQIVVVERLERPDDEAEN